MNSTDRPTEHRTASLPDTSGQGGRSGAGQIDRSGPRTQSTTRMARHRCTTAQRRHYPRVKVWVAPVLLLTLTGCSGAPSLVRELGVNPAAVPAYQVIDEKHSTSAGISRHTATLVIPEVTVEQVTAALATWGDKSDADSVDAMVVRSAGATVYVRSPAELTGVDQ